jgi:hypothetical protein
MCMTTAKGNMVVSKVAMGKESREMGTTSRGLVLGARQVRFELAYDPMQGLRASWEP